MKKKVEIKKRFALLAAIVCLEFVSGFTTIPVQAETLAAYADSEEACIPGASPLPLDLFSFAEGALGANASVVEDAEGPAIIIGDWIEGADGLVPLKVGGFPAIQFLVPRMIPFTASPCPEGRDSVTFQFRNLELGIRLNPDLFPAAGGGSPRFSPAAADLDVIYSLGSPSPELHFRRHVAGGAAGDVEFQLDESFSIAGTGVTVQGGARLSLPAILNTDAHSISSWQLNLRNIQLRLGGFLSRLNGILDDERFDAAIGRGGLSGTFNVLPNDPVREGDITFKTLALSFAQNAITNASIKVALDAPFFKNFYDSPEAAAVDLELALQQDGQVRVALNGPDGDAVHLNVPGVFDLEVTGADFELLQIPGEEVTDYRIRLDGQLMLEFVQDAGVFGAGHGNQPISVPIERLTVSSGGEISLDGGWVRLPQPEKFNFKGFEVTLRGVSFGSEGPGAGSESWIGLDGDVSLTDILPLRGSVQGLRAIWNNGGFNRLELDGIAIDFRQPDVASFQGDIRWAGNDSALQEDQVFRGDVRLAIEAINLTVDAQLTVGKKDNSKFFFVQLFSEFPGGVPIFSGVSLYGLGGLFASNLQPNLDDPGFETPLLWYAEHDRCPGSTVPCSDNPAPWRFEDGALSFGAGALIGSSDNGYAVHAKAALLISIPGPIIAFNGKANILKKRGSLSRGANPIFNAYVTYEPNSFEMGVGVNYELASVIKIQGDAEAFFDLNEPSNWHVYVGKIGGREIQAKIADFLQAKSYYMIHPETGDILDPPVEGSPFHRVPDIAFGAGIGFDKDYRIGPLGIALRALIAGWAGISFDPVHFQGGMDLDGGIELYAFGFSTGFDVGAFLDFETPTPFVIDGKFRVRLKLPWPLPDPKATVHFHWGEEISPDPVSPVLKEVELTARDGSSGLTARLSESDSLPADWLARVTEEVREREKKVIIDAAEGKAPLVPLDFVPQLIFNRPVNDITDEGFRGDLERCFADTVREPKGTDPGVRYAYYLTELEVSMAPWEDDAARYNAFVPAEGDLQPGGVWLADLGSAEGPNPSRVLKLFDENPFSHLAASGFAFPEEGGAGGQGTTGAVPAWIPPLDLAEWLWRRDCAPCPCYPCQPPPPPPPCTTPPCPPPPDPTTCDETERCRGEDIDPETGAGVNCVILPYTVYRVRAVTKAHSPPADDEACEAGLPIEDPTTNTVHVTKYAYFYTQGPPLDLTPYVHEVLPADPSRPHFRSYHLAVRFNRNYVGLLYHDPRVELGGARICNGDPQITVKILDAERNQVSDVSPSVYFGKAEDHVRPVQLGNDDILHVPVDGVRFRPGERYILQLAWLDERLSRDVRLPEPPPENEVALYEFPFRPSRFLGLAELFSTFAEPGMRCPWREGFAYRGTYFELDTGGGNWDGAEEILGDLEEYQESHPPLAAYAARLRDAHPTAAPTGIDDESLRIGLNRVQALVRVFDGIAEGDLFVQDENFPILREIWEYERSAYELLDRNLGLERHRESLPEVVELSVLREGDDYKGFLLEFPEPLEFSRVSQIAASREGSGDQELRVVKNLAGTRLFFFAFREGEIQALPPGEWTIEMSFQGTLDGWGWLTPPLKRSDGFEQEGAALCFELGEDLFELR